MKTADAHCDTLFCFSDNPFHTPEAAWNIEKFQKSNGILQYMAICVLPPHHSDVALKLAVGALGNFYKSKPDIINLIRTAGDFKDDKINIVLTLEGASPLIDDINNLYAYHSLGVRLITLTWNHRNFVADGIGVGGNFGLTDFGKQVVKEMEKLKMIVDVSHLNEAGFKDLCSIAEKPFMASHSNSFVVHEHPRNLKDYQIKEIIERKGFIGINYYSEFIDTSKEKDMLITKLLKHIDYFLGLGAENVLGIGSDFDGITESPFLDASTYPELAELLSTDLNLNDRMIEKIMYKNLLDFTLKML